MSDKIILISFLAGAFATLLSSIIERILRHRFKQVSLLRVRPGDVLVVSSTEKLSIDNVISLQRQFEFLKRLTDAVEVIVLDGGLSVSVIRAEEEKGSMERADA